MRVVKREAVFIPIKAITPQVKERIEEKLTFNFFAKEKICEECEWVAERVNDVCESCANFKGQYKLASPVKVGDGKYLKIPVGSSPEIIRFLEDRGMDVEVQDKSPNTRVKPIKFKGKYRPGQVEAIKAMLKFKRGILKAPPRSGKCVVGSTLIMSDQGLGPIKNLFEDFSLSKTDETIIPVSGEIATFKGTREVSGLYSKVVSTTVKAVTQSGYEIQGTENHPVLVARKGFRHVWVRLDSIRPGDYLVVSRRQQWLGEGSALLPYDRSPKASYEHQFKLPECLSPKLARLLGYWVANGSLSVQNRVGFFTENQEVIDDFLDCLQSVFPDVPYKHTSSDGRTPSVVIAKSAFKRFLSEACDLNMSKAAGKYIPQVILHGDVRYLTEFLSAYVSCDSWVHSNGVQLCTASQRLARELHSVLAYLGILGKFTRRTGSATNGTGKVRNYFNINLQNSQAALLLNKITLRKENKLRAVSVNQHDQLPFVKETLNELTRKMSAPGYASNGPWLVNGITYPKTRKQVLVLNNRKGLLGTRPVNRNFLPKINQRVLRWLDPKLADKFVEFCNPDIAYQEVVSVKTINKPVRVYDVEVPTGRHFVANSLVCHNTVMGSSLVCHLRRKTLILASQRDWLMGFKETFVGSDTQPALTDLDPKRIKLCKTLEDFMTHDVCLATVQTFYSPGGEKLLRKLRDVFSVILVDEVHTSAADKYAQIMAKLNGRYVIGFSGTPDRKDTKEVLVENIIGPIIHEMKTERMQPHIRLTRTGYSKTTKGQVPWAYLVRGMENDKKRIDCIAKQAIRDIAEGHMVLIPTAQVKPIKLIVKRINELAGKTLAYEFTGGLKKPLRDEYIQKARDYKIKCLVGTQKILSVGINIPRASCLYETVLSSNLPNAQQRMARVLTPMDGKPTPVIRFFLDDFGVRRNCMRNEYYRVLVPIFKPVISAKDKEMLESYFRSKDSNGSKFEL